MLIDTERLRKVIGDYFHLECKRIDETIDDDKRAMAEFAKIERMEKENDFFISMVEDLAKKYIKSPTPEKEDDRVQEFANMMNSAQGSIIPDSAIDEYEKDPDGTILKYKVLMGIQDWNIEEFSDATGQDIIDHVRHCVEYQGMTFEDALESANQAIAEDNL